MPLRLRIIFSLAIALALSLGVSAQAQAGSKRKTRYRKVIHETRPLMKVTPLRDGRFILEPLSLRKPGEKSKPTIPDQEKPERPKQDYSKRPDQKISICPRWSFRDLVLAHARQYHGAPYAPGASLAWGRATDCSGFVQHVYHDFQIDLPRSSRQQAQVGKTVTQRLDFARLLPGDLLFFRRGGRHVGHTGIYMGEGRIIHASACRRKVIVADLDQDYFINNFVVAKRVFEINREPVGKIPQ